MTPQERAEKIVRIIVESGYHVGSEFWKLIATQIEEAQAEQSQESANLWLEINKQEYDKGFHAAQEKAIEISKEVDAYDIAERIRQMKL